MEVETSSCVDAIDQHAMASLLVLHRGVLLTAYLSIPSLRNKSNHVWMVALLRPALSAICWRLSSPLIPDLTANKRSRAKPGGSVFKRRRTSSTCPSLSSFALFFGIQNINSAKSKLPESYREWYKSYLRRISRHSKTHRLSSTSDGPHRQIELQF